MEEENGGFCCFSERRMEEEDSVRTVDCLRGRLLAERAASRDAKAEAQHLQTKLMELEKLLKQEAKSRNRAEKKLKFLMKKLQSINILNVSDESEHSGLIDKTDISSKASSIIKQEEINESKFSSAESKGEANLEQIDSHNSSSFSLSDDSHTGEMTWDAKSPEMWKESSSSCASDEQSSSKMDQQSEDSNRSSCGEVDDSMALVVVDTPLHRKVDPEALDATVKQVLNTLRIAKEQLQSSMLRQTMHRLSCSH